MSDKTMKETMEARSCDNLIYLRNLVESLEDAKVRRDIDRIILYATELERFKVLCGDNGVIEKFQQSLKRVTEELGLTQHPTIQRALNTTPKKQCSECCEQPPNPEGFIAMVEASRQPTSPERLQPQETANSEFQRMLRASGNNNQPLTIPSVLIPAIDESQFPDLCNPAECPPNYSRHCRANRAEHYGEACIYKTVKNR